MSPTQRQFSDGIFDVAIENKRGGGNGECMTARDPLLSLGRREPAHKPSLRDTARCSGALGRLLDFVDHAAASHDACDIGKRDCSADFKKVK
jgi:hypothetical protein